MSLTSIILIGITIVFAYFVIRFLWKTFSFLLKLLLIVAVVIIGLFFFKPDILHEQFGKENVDKISKTVIEKTTEVSDSVTQSLTEKLK